MAFAFHTAGFSAIDVHMTDLISNRVSLSSFVGLAACGGFSYGDVLGAGQGWAKSVLLHPNTRKEFKDFFERKDTFTLGVCNGCQFLSRLKDLIPGAETWPTFERNTSEQYEARVCMVEVLDNPTTPSVFLHGMAGSKLPIAVAHGEGRASFTPSTTFDQNLVSLRYVDNHLQPTAKIPVQSERESRGDNRRQDTGWEGVGADAASGADGARRGGQLDSGGQAGGVRGCGTLGEVVL